MSVPGDLPHQPSFGESPFDDSQSPLGVEQAGFAAPIRTEQHLTTDQRIELAVFQIHSTALSGDTGMLWGNLFNLMGLEYRRRQEKSADSSLPLPTNNELFLTATTLVLDFNESESARPGLDSTAVNTAAAIKERLVTDFQFIAMMKGLDYAPPQIDADDSA